MSLEVKEALLGSGVCLHCGERCWFSVKTALLHLSPPGPSGSCSVHILTGDQSVPAKRDELYFSIIPAAVGKLHKGIRQKAACCWTSG